MNYQYPFDKAVADYMISLSNERKIMLRNSVPIPRHEQDWPWFEDVIERYHLRDKNSPVRRDINERIEHDPDELNSEWWSSDCGGEPIFEAMTLLDAVRQALKAQLAQ